MSIRTLLARAAQVAVLFAILAAIIWAASGGLYPAAVVGRP